MLLKNLFKQRKPEEELDPGEEPARVVAPPPSIDRDLKRRTAERLKPQSGFDPYNSGSFKRDDAWQRVTRK
jgi:hypothetical protein